MLIVSFTAVSGGSRTTSPLNSGRIRIWQQSRDVCMAPGTTSRSASSLSDAGRSRENHPDSTITWQLAQASFPPQVPRIGSLFILAITITDTPSGATTRRFLPLDSTKVISDKFLILLTCTSPAFQTITARGSGRGCKATLRFCRVDWERQFHRITKETTHSGWTILGRSLGDIK
jgi:hypothetical protein